MEIQEIQGKLNNLLSGNERKIVFWYDDDAAYAEEIDSIQLGEGCKLHKLTGKNDFATKLLLEHQDLTTNYLVYAPYVRPKDKENSLADIFYYAGHFSSDKMNQLMEDMCIPVECQNEVRRYKKFWTSGNLTKFKALQIGEYTPGTIVLGILCVLAGVKSLNVEELVRKAVLAGTSENAVLKKFDLQKITPVFWKICEKYYGYKDGNPTVQKFLVTMLVTYMDTQMSGNEPKVWTGFVSGKQNDAFIFVKNLMNHDESRAFYDDFARKAASELNAKNLITSIPLEYVLVSDVFEDLDENLINWIIAKIEDSMLDEKIDGLSIPEICDTRCKAGYYYADKYRSEYQMLSAVYHVMKEISLHSYQPAIQEVVEDYVGGTYLIDTYYHKFYYFMDMVGMTENTEKIKDLVENIYTNRYLTDFAAKWNNSLTNEAYDTYADTKQEDFFATHVKPFMREGGKEGRVIVIISDGMRYECAQELLENLELDEKCDAKISHMLSVLPSETTLGVASLLPHKEIVVSGDLDITVDNMHCGNSLADCQKVLQASVPRSACYDFDVVKDAKQAEIRDMFVDKDVIYLYQNQIYSRGEGMRTENEVFNACQEAIKEIHELIHKLTGYISNTRYLVTADHGFIYKRDKLVESDKITVDKLGVTFKNKRYLLSEEPIQNNALISRCMAYISKLNNIYVTTPIGADIIKMPGGGQNYVHGGSSLQEMIAPVIKVTTFKGKQDTGLVNVELSTFNHRVTGIEVKLDFMQMEPVSDTVKARCLQAFFVDADGAKISFPVPITANVKSADARDRLIQEKFTLKSGRYNRTQDYYLVIADQDDETKELHRYKFEIDIADFRFSDEESGG